MPVLLGQGMKAIAGGLSAGSSLALAHHFLSLVEPKVDPLSLCSSVCSHSSGSWDFGSFVAGLLCGVVLFAAAQAFTTLRWAFCELVRIHLAAASEGAGQEGAPRKVYYKILG